MDSLITAAAEMALADGKAEPVEQQGLLAFLRQDNMLATLGRRATLERFTAALNDVAERQVAAAPDAPDLGPDLAEALRPVAGSHAARLVARAAAHVAAADGTLHPKELALLRALHTALGLTRAEQPA